MPQERTQRSLWPQPRNSQPRISTNRHQIETTDSTDSTDFTEGRKKDEGGGEVKSQKEKEPHTNGDFVKLRKTPNVAKKEKEPRIARITRILAHHQEDNIEDPDSSGINYKVPRNPRRTVPIEKPHWKSAACQMPPKGETPKRPMQPSKGSIANARHQRPEV